MRHGSLCHLIGLYSQIPDDDCQSGMAGGATNCRVPGFGVAYGRVRRVTSNWTAGRCGSTHRGAELCRHRTCGTAQPWSATSVSATRTCAWSSSPSLRPVHTAWKSTIRTRRSSSTSTRRSRRLCGTPRSKRPSRDNQHPYQRRSQTRADLPDATLDALKALFSGSRQHWAPKQYLLGITTMPLSETVKRLASASRSNPIRSPAGIVTCLSTMHRCR